MWLNISTQPISTIRSPPLGLRPVVSVSNTISRIAMGLPLLSVRQAALRGRPVAPGKGPDDPLDLAACKIESAPGIDDQVGATALFRIRRLASQNRLKPLRGHPC